MNSDFKRLLSEYQEFTEKQLINIFNSIDQVPPVLADAMRYAVLDGGKRIRPVLCFAVSDMLGVNKELVKEFAIAIECIHSYSLIHDDLPAMDNDDYRRGKLSTHKKFGEAIGILAGDALLNFAFEICLNKQNFTAHDAKALKLLADYAGSVGMIKGQVLDLQNEKSAIVNEQTLYDVYLNKTAKLIMAPILIPSIIANKKHFEELKEYAFNLGVMFQISDDIMDVEGTVELIGKTPNKDADSDKLTSIKVLGLSGAKERSEKHYLEAIKILGKINAPKFIFDLTEKMYKRKK